MNAPTSESTIESTIELIELAVDGEISPAQRAELDTILATSPEARGYLESMTEISRRIESAPLVESSHSIRDDVMAALRNKTAPVVFINQRRSRRQRLLAYGWLAAAAVVVLVALYPIASGRKTEISPSQAGATMTAMNVDSWPVVARTSAQRDGRMVMLRVRRNGNELAVESELHPAREAAVTIRWNPSQMEPLDFAFGKLDDGRNTITNSATFRDGGTKPPRLLLRLRPGAAGPSEVAVLSGGVELVKTSIELN